MKILVVDDEALVRKAIVRALKLGQHQVFEAADGVEGLAMWRECHPDVVLLDVVMPGLTGPQVLKEIGDRGATKVILMTAFSGHIANELTPMDYDAFFHKPFEDVFAVVREVERL